MSIKRLEQLPAKANINFVKGDDYLLDVEITDNEGLPIDFSAWSDERIQVRNFDDNSILFEEDVNDNLTTTAGGRVTVTLPSSENGNWPDRVKYEVDGTDGNGNSQSVLRGQIKLEEEIAGN